MRLFSTPLGRWLGLAALAVAVAGPATAQRTVTLRMNSATMPDTISTIADSAGIQVRGCLEGCANNQSQLPDGAVIAWDANTTLVPDNAGGDYWEIDFQIPDNQKLVFKFYFDQSQGVVDPDGWESGADHSIEAGTGDVVRDLHYFNKTGMDQPYDWRPFAAAGDSIAVWFRVFMNTQVAGAKGYDGDDENLMVGARGNFGFLGAEDADGPLVDWGEGGDTDVGVRLTRESTDATRPGYALFSGVAKYPASAAGQGAGYKFYFRGSNTTGDAGYENSSDRSFTVPAAGTDTTLHWVFFSNSPELVGEPPPPPPPVVRDTVLTTFIVDVKPLADIGLFSGDDRVLVVGGFNDWGCPDAGSTDSSDDCLLSQVPFSTSYSREIPVGYPVGTPQFYKFYIDNNPGMPDRVGWEEPLDFGGSNRPLPTPDADDQDLGTQFFNSIRPGNVIAAEQSIDVTFTVDMNRAASFDTDDPFIPGTDTVTVVFQDPVWLLTQGIESGGAAATIPGFRLDDADGDGIYTGTLTVNGPTYNGIGYGYAYSNASRSTPEADGQIIEGGGDQPGRRRYRYILDREADAYSFALDVIRPTGATIGTGEDAVPNPLPWEINPTGTVQPGQYLGAVANGYVDTGNPVASEGPAPLAGALSLGNVYPNPTTGNARVVVSGRADARVTVRVYDVTGRVVGMVAEDELISERPLEIDTRGLAAGLYLVRADSESGVATARLTVVR